MRITIAKKKLLDFHKRDIEYAIKASSLCFRGDALSKSRKMENVYARQALSVYLRELGFVFSEIGKLTGFDHANIIHLTKKHEYDILYDKNYKSKFFEFITLVDKKANKSYDMVYCYQYPIDYAKMKATTKF